MRWRRRSLILAAVVLVVATLVVLVQGDRTERPVPPTVPVPANQLDTPEPLPGEADDGFKPVSPPRSPLRFFDAATASFAHFGSQWFGTPFSADRSNDPPVGGGGTLTGEEVAITFRSPMTGQADTLTTIFTDGTQFFGQPGYYCSYACGDGGDIRARLYAAEPGFGMPTGPVLASVTVTMGLDPTIGGGGGYICAYPAGCASGWQHNKAPTFNFSPDVSLTAGNRYAIVFDNVDPTPTLNWRALHWQDYYDEQGAFTASPEGGSWPADGDGWDYLDNLGVHIRVPTQNGGAWYPSHLWTNATTYNGYNLVPSFAVKMADGAVFGNGAFSVGGDHGRMNGVTTGIASLGQGCVQNSAPSSVTCDVRTGRTPMQRFTAPATFSVDRVRLPMLPYVAGNITVTVAVNGGADLGSCSFAIPTLDQSAAHPGYPYLRTRNYMCTFGSAISLTSGTTYNVRVSADGTAQGSVLITYDPGRFGYGLGPLFPGGDTNPGQYVTSNGGTLITYADMQMSLRIAAPGGGGGTTTTTTTTTPNIFPDDADRSGPGSAFCVGGTRFQAEAVGADNSSAAQAGSYMWQGGAGVANAGSPANRRNWSSNSPDAQINWWLPGGNSDPTSYTYRIRYASTGGATRLTRSGGDFSVTVTFPATAPNTWGTVDVTDTVPGNGTEGFYSIGTTSGSLLVDYVDVCAGTPTPTTTTTTTIATTTSTTTTTTIPNPSVPAGTSGGTPACSGGVRLEGEAAEQAGTFTGTQASGRLVWQAGVGSFVRWRPTYTVGGVWSYTVRYWSDTTVRRWLYRASPFGSTYLDVPASGGGFASVTITPSGVSELGEQDVSLSWDSTAEVGAVGIDYVDACPPTPTPTTTTTSTTTTTTTPATTTTVASSCTAPASWTMTGSASSNTATLGNLRDGSLASSWAAASVGQQSITLDRGITSTISHVTLNWVTGRGASWFIVSTRPSATSPWTVRGFDTDYSTSGDGSCWRATVNDRVRYIRIVAVTPESALPVSLYEVSPAF